MNSPTKLIAVFREVFELDDTVDVSALEYRDVQQWDSVGHMRLIAGIEEAFDVMLDTHDVLDMSSLEKAIEILQKYDVDPFA